MSVCILREDWEDSFYEKYTVYPNVDEFNDMQPAPREVYLFHKEEVSIPFAEWKQFYDEFPESFTSQPFSDNVEYLGELRQKAIYEEAWKKIQKNHYVFLHLSTAVGKTFLGIYLVYKLGKKFVMSTYRSKLFPQWFESIQKFSTLRVQHIKTGKTVYEKPTCY